MSSFLLLGGAGSGSAQPAQQPDSEDGATHFYITKCTSARF